MEMKKIMLTTDFSQNAGEAADAAIQLFGSDNAEYTLINTYMEPQSSARGMASIVDFLRKESNELIEKEQNRLKEKFGTQLKLNATNAYGRLALVLDHFLEENPQDFVVIGTKGVSEIENFVMGSNTLEVIKSTPTAVLVIPQNAKLGELKHMIVAADGKAIDKKIFNGLRAFNEVVSPKMTRLTVHHNALETIEEPIAWAEAMEGLTYDEETVVNDDVTEGIWNFCDANDVDFITMVRRQHSFFERLFKKSITKELSKLAKLPMLVLHE